MPHAVPTVGRRDFLLRAGAGFGAVALAGLRADAAPPAADPLAPKAPHFAPKAKRVIFLFQYGGPSQVDLFDHKPDLLKLAGKPVPESLKKHPDKVGGVFNQCKDELLAGPWKWRQHGQSGRWFSELLPETAKFADDLCFVRSMTSDSSNHAPATFQMNTGSILAGKPSLGSWLTYGLGTENRNLPGFVVLFKVAGLGGSPNWGNGFLPAAHQGTRFRHEGEPVLDLRPPAEFAAGQRSTLDLVDALNRKHATARPGLADLDGRIAAYELAYRMQAEALEVGDLAKESKETLELYGVNSKNKDEAHYGRTCLLARRLSEKGVRFVQTYSAVDKEGWDGHGQSHDYHRRNAAQVDRPTAALLTDLKRRGLLDETLVIWAGEFGRTPMLQGGDGRNHNPSGYALGGGGGGGAGGDRRDRRDRAPGGRVAVRRQGPARHHPDGDGAEARRPVVRPPRPAGAADRGGRVGEGHPRGVGMTGPAASAVKCITADLEMAVCEFPTITWGRPE